MQIINRTQLKKIFQKVKHLKLPPDLEEANFDELKYFGWIDRTNEVAYLLYELDGSLQGLRWKINKLNANAMKMGFCDICKKHHKMDELVFIYARTKHLPKGIDYRSRGRYICTDSLRCNKDMKDEDGIRDLFLMILGE